MHRRFTTILRFCLVCLFVAGAVFQPQSSAYALTTLTVEPLTWNVLGLDSNNVSVGPNHFPVAARVCNSGSQAATNVTAVFNWDTADAYIALRPGTLGSINLGTLNAGACADAYFEVEVTRNSSAYDHTRDYHISVTAGNVSGTISTPTPRELYVEHLVSQSRNAVTDMRLDGVSVAPGGTMTLMVGQTYSIQLVGYTATQGYEQIEYFINFPNTIFQILSVSSTFDADSSATVGPSPINTLYGDNCVWENDPNSPNYRACLSTGKTGGNITTTYQVKILQVPAAPLVNPEPLSTLIYDFSGSSFHYNADYGVSTRYANIVNASLTKSFSPKTINPNGTSTLTFSVSNPGPSAISGVNFTDDLPAGMTLANNTVMYSGCGAALPASVSDPMSFSNITVAGYGTCTIAVTVTSAADGMYNNTSGNLFLGTADTGSVAGDSLIVSSSPGAPSSCGSPTTMAAWDFSNYTAATSTNNGPFNESNRAVDVTDANTSATYGNSGASTSAIVNTTTYPATWTDPTATGNVGNSWGIQSGWLGSSPADPTTVTNSPSTTPYFQFQVDASKYGGIGLTASYNLRGNWSNGDNWYVLFSTTGANGSWSLLPSANRAWTKSEWRTVLNPPAISGTSTSTGNSTVYFRVYASGAQNATAVMYLDTVQITGCSLPIAPNLSKSFVPPSIGTGNSSVLTFTLTNPNTTTSLPNISFSDVLPAGLTIVSGSTTACTTGTLTTTAPRTISLSGGTLAASGTCTINVTVRGAIAGAYTNVSSSVSSSDTGPNTTASGYGTASLTVIDAPVLAKSFTANPIFTGNSTTLDFDIVNPNPSTALTGVTFSDVLPAGLSVANGTFSVCGGTDNLTTSAATRTISLLNTTTIAAGGTCSFSVTVTGSTAGSYTNTTGSISSTNGGTGNTASANVLVKTPAPAISILKQVGSSATGPWTSFLTTTVGANVYYKISVENVGDLALNSISVSDPIVSLAGCTWTDGDGTTLSPLTTLPVADASNNQIATCILGPVLAVSGLHSNSATASGSNGSTVNDTSTARYGTTAITIAKSVTQTSFSAAGDILNYSYLVTNSGGAPLLGPVTVSDDKATVTCPAVSTVGDGDNWLDPADYPAAGTSAESLTCTASYTVLDTDVTAGFVTNTASATVSGVTSNTDSKTVNGSADLAITKNDSVTSVNAGATTNYTIRVTNAGPGGVTGAILSDPLVVGLTKTAVACSATPGQCTAPTTPSVAQLEGGTFALPALANGQFYEITVTATVDATSGSVTNTATVASPTGGNDPDLTNNTASDTDTVTPVADLQVSKTNSAASVNAGGTTTYTVRVTNNGPSAVTSAILSDPSAAGLTKTGVACSTTPGQCVTAPTVPQLEGGALTLPALASGQFYEITVTATVSATSGNVTNTASITPPVGTTNPGTSCVTSGGITRTFNAGTGTCTSSDNDPVIPVIDLSLDKQVGNASPSVGSTVTFTLVVTNGGPSAATNIVVTDVVPSGYTYNATSIAGGDARDASTPATTGLTWTINSLASGASTNLTYQATVLGTGTYNNYAEITSHTETDSDSAAGNGQQVVDEDDDDTQVVTPVSIVAPSIEKQFLPNPVALNGVSTLTFSILNPNAGVALTDVAFTDNLPAGMQVAATPNATTSACGSPTFAPASGNTTLTFSGGTIAGGATCTVSVDVVSTTAGTKTNTTGNVSSTNGGTGNTASAKLGVVNALKTVIATSEDSSSELDAPRLVLVAEIVRYRLVIELPEGTTMGLQFVDSVVANMAYLNDNSTRVAFVCNSGASCASSSVAAIGTNPVLSGSVSAVTPSFILPAANISGGTGNPYGDGVNPVFSLGNVTNNDNDSDSEYVVIEFNTLVRNTTGNQDTDTRGNDFTVHVNGSALVSSTDNANSRITITEPVISTITKSITTTPADAGDTITYRLQFTNTGTAPAFDISIMDTLNAVLTTPVTVSGSTTGGSCGSTASLVSGSYTAPTVSATVTCLAAGATATVNITANVSNTALAGYTFTNTANLTYTSLPGNGSAGNPTGSLTPGGGINNSNGERSGSGTGANDYIASSNTVSTTLASPSLAKSINPAGTLFAVGTTIPYQITVTVPEGVTGGPLANIVETIPTGLSYVAGSLTVTPQAEVTIGTAGPYTDANVSFFNLSGQAMTLTFGSFTSTASASATNRTVTIAFLARVDNVAGNQTGTSFTNSVDFVRTNPNGAGTLTLNATDASASVAEPALNVGKAASSVTPAYNSTLTYTLTLTHIAASNSSAYDVQITDTPPAGLTSLTNVNVASTGSCATGVTNSSTGSLLNVTIGTIPLGCTVTITYDVTVSGGLGSVQTNSVDVAWTSRTGTVYERSGVDGPGGALNDYADSNSEPVTVSGPDFRTFKTDGSATYSPGSPITYTITVNNDGNTTATGSVTDTFSATLTGVTWSCSGTGGATCGASGSGNINDAVSIPAGESVTYSINATVAVGATGNLSNTAVAALSSGTDPTPGNNSSTDTDTPADLFPDAVADTNTATEGGAAVNGNVITNENSLGDTPTTVSAADQGGTAITFGTPFSTSAGGTLTLNTDGTYTYAPPATLPEGATVTEVFNYTITDADGDIDATTLTITVDRLPAAVPDTNKATEGGANATGNVITNDDEGNTSATVTAGDQGGTAITPGTPFSTTAGGTLTLNANGSYTYTPPATLSEGSTLTEVFNYTITDADGDTSSSTLTITVDRLPQANPDTNTATESGANATGNVITNDDEGNTSATVTSANQGATAITIGSAFTTAGGGTLTLNANGAYTYTPPAINLVPPGGLTEVFNYTITDADGDTSSSTLTITVNDSDRLPDAVPDVNTATEGGVNATGNVITNENSLGDTPTTVTVADQSGTAITIGTAFTTSAGGTLTLNADGTYTYTPPATLPEGAVLTEVFNYTITDVDGDTDATTLTITVDRLPNAVADTNTATEGGMNATGNVVANDDEGNTNANVTAANQSGTPITIGTPFATTGGGTLTLNADGSYTYAPPSLGTVPPAGLTEVFSYTITDDDGDTSSSTLTITVTDSDLLPDAVPDTNAATEGGANTSGNVITNENSLGDTPTTVTAADQGGTAITIGTAFTTSAGGTLTLNATGTYTYTPPSTLPEGATLTEVFNYTITDVDGDIDSTTLTITVDRLPQANPDTNSATEGGANATGTVITNDDEGNVSANVASVSQGGTAITIGAAFTTSAGGTLTLNADGTYTYTPPATLPEGGALTEVFNYTIADNDGDTSSSTLTITIDRLPNAVADTDAATEGGPNATGNVITNDDEGNTSATVTIVVDDDGDMVSIGTPFTTDGGGTLTLNANGTYSYSPPAINLVPPAGLAEVFTYTIRDADGDISSTTLTITVDDTDLVPDAVADTNTATEGGVNATGDVLTNENSLGDTPTTVTAVVDDDGDPLTLGTAFATDGGGSLTINANGTYTYTPPAVNLVPPAGLVEVFTYTITDADGDPDTTTLTITVNDSDRLPVAINNSYTINAGATAGGNVMTDGTADTLGDPPTTVTSFDATSANGGIVTVAANGTFTYDPNGFVGTDTFTYTITDADGDLSTATVTITVDESLVGVSKRVVSTTEVSAGTYDVTYELYIENFGTTVLNNIQVTEDLSTTFPAPTIFTVQSVNSAAFAENGSYNGSSNINLLSGSDNLALGASGNITLVVRVVPASGGPFQNTATVSGQCPTCTTPVTDNSQDGSDPDPDSDGDPANDNDATPLTFGPNLFDPPFGLKVVDASGLPVLQWTMVWINDSNIVAINAQVSDPISAGTSYAGGLTCVASGVTTTTSCTYETPSGAYPRGRVIWSGDLAPDLGATDAASAANEITITFNVNVNSAITSVQNNATIDSDLNGDDDITDPGEQSVASASSSWEAPPAPTGSGNTNLKLPATGFAPNVVTDLSNVASEKYTATGDMTVEIPSLKVEVPVVGVPKKDGTWNVSWLGNQAGWLEGTAFPSWSGNSVLTSHVYLSNGLPGPFVNLGKLKYGDKIVIHAYGQKYTFEVRTNQVVEPNDTSAIKHEEKSWLTLVTCKEYDEKTNMYRKRIVVRAVLVNVALE